VEVGVIETIWTAAARRVPVFDQLDRTAPLRPVPPEALAAHRARVAEMLKPFAARPRSRRCAA
jgi:hypothetical protein